MPRSAAILTPLFLNGGVGRASIAIRPAPVDQTRLTFHAWIVSPLVFDLGMHVGDDTDYYLARGFRVVAVEANPALIAEASVRRAPEIKEGKLSLVGAALADSVGTAKFYIAKANAEWSSLDQWRVDKTGTAEEVSVPTLTLDALYQEFGLPYFIKCDIEGADGTFCQQLLRANHKPRFVSVEAIDFEWFALLSAAGYRQFQLINQARIRRFRPSISFDRAGQKIEWKFGAHSSGPFGDDLPSDEWLNFRDVSHRWLDFQRMKAAAPSMAMDNWFDLHAKR